MLVVKWPCFVVRKNKKMVQRVVQPMKFIDAVEDTEAIVESHLFIN